MTAQTTGRFRALLPVLIDVLAPVVVYFVLKRLGVGDFWALTIGGGATGVNAVIGTVRRRRLDGVGLLVVLEIALTVALLFVVNDPRIVLVKPSFYTALAAVYLLATCFVGRPIVYEAAAPMATKGDPERLLAYERAWERSPKFRRKERAITAAFGVALLVEAVLRAVVVYHFSAEQIDQSVLLSQTPGIVLLVAVLAFTRLQVPALRKIVDAQQEELSRERKLGQQ